MAHSLPMFIQSPVCWLTFGWFLGWGLSSSALAAVTKHREWVACEQPTFISNSAGGWEVQDQGASTFSVYGRPASCFIAMTKDEGLSSIRVLIPLMRPLPPCTLISCLNPGAGIAGLYDRNMRSFINKLPVFQCGDTTVPARTEGPLPYTLTGTLLVFVLLVGA